MYSFLEFKNFSFSCLVITIKILWLYIFLTVIPLWSWYVLEIHLLTNPCLLCVCVCVVRVYVYVCFKVALQPSLYFLRMKSCFPVTSFCNVESTVFRSMCQILCTLFLCGVKLRISFYYRKIFWVWWEITGITCARYN